jgi:beta-mannosidase
MIGDPKSGTHSIVAVNDTREASSGKVIIRDADSGKTLFSRPFNIPSNGKTVIGTVPSTSKQAMWLIEYTIGDKKYTNHYLAGKAPFKLEDYNRWYRKLNITRE